MTTAYTSLLGLALPVTGELSGTWGDTVNNSITSLVDTAVAGTTNVSADSNVTLTTTTGASNQARQAILLFSGARTAIRTVTAPAQSKIYTVINATTGGFAVTLVGAGPTTGLTIPNGASATVAWNGSDFVEIGASRIGNLTVNGNLSVTGASSFTGNVAIGTTLSAWGSGRPTLEFGGSVQSTIGFNANPTNGGAIWTNSFYNGTNNIYKQTGPASLFATPNGTYEFNIAPSGTAGATATFTLAMLLNNSGNLGLGATPSGWASFRALDLQYNGALASFSSGAVTLVYNAFFNGGSWIAKSTGSSSKFGLDSNGSYSWQQASSVTGGSAFTYSTAMTLDASGYLLVGATSSAGAGASRLQVGSTASSTSQILLQSATTSLSVYASTAAEFYLSYATGSSLEIGDGPANGSAFTGRVRVDTSGNFAINGGYFLTRSTAQSMGLFGGPAVANNCARFEANGSTYPSTANHAFVRGEPIVFSNITAGEYARINSSGNFLVGNTSSSFAERIVSYSSSSYTYGSYRTGTGSEGHIIFSNGNGAVGSIFTNGTTTSFNTSSDYRLKNITGPITNSGAYIDSLNPVEGTWKADGSTFVGLIAHEAQEVSRTVVATGVKDGEEMQGMDYSSAEIIANLIAEVQSLRKRLANAGI